MKVRKKLICTCRFIRLLMFIFTSMRNKAPEGRGTGCHTPNKYLHFNALPTNEWDAYGDSLDSANRNPATQYVEVHAKSMVNTVLSPDLAMDYSLNPYQGCEHGCCYCYARPTHNYWGYSSGDDFEQKIFIKTNALEILKKELCARNYRVKPIMLSGNTDCYQPAEKKFKITRSILQLMLEWNHPVMLITKNALILRDLDILKSLSDKGLCKVSISMTASDEALRRKMEPRASSIYTRLSTISRLHEAGIHTHVMVAPVIPGINSNQISNILKMSAEAGAQSASYQLLRLNGDLPVIFEDWLDREFPDRKQKVLHQIAECHGGQLHDSRFNIRMKGEGRFAEILNQQFTQLCKKYFPNNSSGSLRTDLFRPSKNGQMQIW